MNDQRSDDELLGLLGRGLSAADPVPQRMTTAAQNALAWHNIDNELAQLVYDSQQETELVGVRDDDGNREMTFEAPGVEIEITVQGETREVLGQLVPPGAADVTIAVGDRIAETTADELGRFRFEGVTPGPIRLTVASSAPGRTIHTEWFVI